VSAAVDSRHDGGAGGAPPVGLSRSTRRSAPINRTVLDSPAETARQWGALWRLRIRPNRWGFAFGIETRSGSMPGKSPVEISPNKALALLRWRGGSPRELRALSIAELSDEIGQAAVANSRQGTIVSTMDLFPGLYERFMRAIGNPPQREVDFLPRSLRPSPPSEPSSSPARGPAPFGDVGPASLLQLTECKVAGPPPPTAILSSRPTRSAVAAVNSRQPAHGSPVRLEDTVPTRARRWRENVERDVWEQRERLGSIGGTTAPHRRLELLRWPAMCRSAGLPGVDLACAADVTPEQVLAVKRCGLWRVNTLRPLFSAVKGFCRRNGNRELLDQAGIWKLPRETEDRRVWLTEQQLSDVHAASSGRVRIIVTLGGFLGMREDSARALRVQDLRFDGAMPSMSFAAKGPAGRRQTVPLAEDTARALRSWIEQQGLRGPDRLYRWSHATFDGDLRSLGKRIALPFPLSGHVLRRSWARIAYMADPSLTQLRGIQQVLGHSSLSQSEWYVGTPRDDMAEALARFNDRMRSVAGPQGA
jgi:integrase